MKAVVTGATGFIGSRLVLDCLAAGMEVVALGKKRAGGEDANADEIERQGVAIQEIPVEDQPGLTGAMQGADVVFHLAAAQHEANVPDEYFRRINVEGTRNVFDAAIAAGVGRVVHGSTIGVYGWQAGVVTREDSPLEPTNIYGVTKLEGEGVVRSYEGRIPFAIARISETYGPGDRRLLKLYKGAERGLGVQIGAGQNLHHIVYVDDLVAGLRAAAERPEAVGRTFVLAGPEPVTSRAMIEAVARSLGQDPRVLRVPMAPLLWTAALLENTLGRAGIQPPLHRRRMDFFRKSFAFSLDAAAAFGFKPRVGLDEGMQATARWYSEQGLIGTKS